MCLQSTTSANDVCDAINKVTTASAKLTGLTLNVNDEFLITLIVSATGREGGVASQTVSTLI